MYSYITVQGQFVLGEGLESGSLDCIWLWVASMHLRSPASNRYASGKTGESDKVISKKKFRVKVDKSQGAKCMGVRPKDSPSCDLYIFNSNNTLKQDFFYPGE